MNKKELESVYNRLESTIIKLGRQNGKNQFAKDLNYLLEQVELNQDLQEQNKRYREALQEIIDSSTNEIAEFIACKTLEESE